LVHLVYDIYYQIVHDVHKRVIKLLASANSRPNERDIEPFRTKINSSKLWLRLQREDLIYKLEIRSLERGICPIAKSVMTELFL